MARCVLSSPFRFPSCALEDDLTHSRRLHNLWPLHLIEKENKLIGKTHNAQHSLGGNSEGNQVENRLTIDVETRCQHRGDTFY